LAAAKDKIKQVQPPVKTDTLPSEELLSTVRMDNSTHSIRNIVYARDAAIFDYDGMKVN
jgi:hypothetical protein